MTQSTFRRRCTDVRRDQAGGGPDEKAATLSTINDFAIELLSIGTTSDLVWYVAREVVARLGFVDCVIYLLNEAGDTLRQVAAIGVKNPQGEQIVNALRIPVGKGITGRVAQSKAPLIVDDLSKDETYIPDVEPALSEICVPLLIDDAVVGVIDCEDPRPAHFGQAHLEILTTVAAMTSGKLKLLEEARQAEARAEALSRLNTQHEREILERKKTEERLRENQALIQALVHHAPVAISIKDRAGRYSFVSPAFCRSLGPSVDEAVGRTSEELLPPEAAAKLRAADEMVLATGEALGADKAFAVEIGPLMHLITKFPVRDPQGEIVGIGTIGVDITEQEKTKEALSRNEAYLRALVEANPSSIFLKDLERRYVLINSAFEKVLGRRREEIVGKTVAELELYDRTFVEEIDAFDDEVLRSGKAIHREQQSYLADGSRPTTILTKFPIFGADGKPSGIGTMETDITEQKQAEERLRQSEQRLRQATKLARIGYYLWDAVDERCLFCSEEHARLHGLSPQAFIDRTASAAARVWLVHPEDRELFEHSMRELRGGRSIEIEYRILTPGGDCHYIREVAEPIFDEAKRVVQEVGASQDMTALRRVESRLAQAQKMEAVGQLTGGIAHDFNNLLAIIAGNAEILDKEVAEETGGAKPMLSAISRAAGRGSELTSRLLAFSRRQPLRPVPIYLSDLVGSMSDLLRRSLGETIEIAVRAEPDLWPAMVDPGQVENAILNLALNARDAMPAGGALAIECANVCLDEAFAKQHPETRAGDHVVLTVADCGSGMSDHVRDHAFEPFFTTKDVGEGSGLGLSMVYGFAKQSGGHVTIESAEGRGTTVKLYLPRSDEPARPAQPKPSESLPQGRGESVLLIEDDPDVRSLMSTLLTNLGYRIIEAADASAARAALADDAQIDVVLSDVVLPGGTSGPAFVQELQSQRPELPVVFMSGYSAEAARRDGFLGPNSQLLQKPFGGRELALVLQKALG